MSDETRMVVQEATATGKWLVIAYVARYAGGAEAASIFATRESRAEAEAWIDGYHDAEAERR